MFGNQSISNFVCIFNERVAFTAKYFRYWPEMRMPEYEKSEMSGRNLLRLKGAFLGYNSLDPPMELWPDAKWGNAKYFFF